MTTLFTVMTICLTHNLHKDNSLYSDDNMFDTLTHNLHNDNSFHSDENMFDKISVTYYVPH